MYPERGINYAKYVFKRWSLLAYTHVFIYYLKLIFISYDLLQNNLCVLYPRLSTS